MGLHLPGFHKKDIFLDILQKLTRITDDMHRMSDQELARLVASHLEIGKFLIVMDDVWTTEDWDKLNIALPKRNNTGKVLITSRNVDVAQFANRDRLPHKLRFLTPDESWLLLQLEVFGKPGCPYDLEVYGKLIVDQCRRLPLAIVVIGGILVKRFSASDEMSVKNAWKKVSENVSTYLTDKDPERRMEKIIALSYDKLPYHLRACFLYFGIFPEDFEIPVWKLIRMWIAEGFIQQKVGSTLEETAERYLDDLINRNLVRVDKKKSNGKAKTCRIHDMLREFCKTEGGNDRENFLQEVKSRDRGFHPPVSDVQKYRRLCIHSNVLNFLSSKPFGPRVRSFACFSTEEITLGASRTTDIPDAFKLLRVLEATKMKFARLPSSIYQLVHLRYITLSFSLAILPSHFSKLWNLETLVVETSPSRTLDIQADIWKMIRLRHLKTNASATLPKTGKSTKEGENLQTLRAISPKSCTEDVFKRTHDLKSLAIRGRLALLLEGKSGSFDSLVKLEKLEKMKLLNDVFPLALVEGKLHSLPQHCKFPPNLKSLSLSKTYLDWRHMSVLGLLDKLEVLKLKEHAFMGKSWEATDGGFRHLRVLHIGQTDLVVWVASEHHFPGLRRLELKNCDDLLEIPIKLANIPNLELLDVYRCKSAAASAKKIRDVIQMMRQEEEQTAGVGMFKLTIFPPDD